MYRVNLVAVTAQKTKRLVNLLARKKRLHSIVGQNASRDLNLQKRRTKSKVRSGSSSAWDR